MLTIKFESENMNNVFFKDNTYNIQKELESFGIFFQTENIIQMSNEKKSITFLRKDNIDNISDIENLLFEDENILSIYNNNNSILNDDIKNLSKNNIFANKLNYYFKDLNELLLNEGFYDNEKFNNFQKQYINLNIDENNQIYGIINMIHQKIKEKMEYFMNSFQNYKKNIFQDLGILIKQINTLESINKQNFDFKNNINENIRLLEKKIELIKDKNINIINLFDEIKIILNKFFLDLIETNLIDRKEFDINYLNNNDFIVKLEKNIFYLLNKIKIISEKKLYCNGCLYCEKIIKNISFNEENIYNI